MDYETESSDKRLLIADLPNDERPRERLQHHGAECLSLAELLAILLRTGRAGRSVLDVASDLLLVYNHDLAALAAAKPADLARVKGIGPAKAAELCAAFNLATRLARYVKPERPNLSSPESVAEFLRPVFAGKVQEELHVLLLDTKNRLIRDEVITVGLLDRSHAHAREVFRPAIQHSAAKLILAHNHPSGDPTPSKADLSMTRALVDAGELMEIRIVDHLVIGHRTATRPRDYHSFREHGQIG